MNKEEIKKILPHREPMLLLDEVEKITEEKDGVATEYAHGIYHVKGDEFFLQGHFPGMPVVPGVIQCEIIAQSACVLFEGALQEGKVPMYTGLDKVRFKNSVRPGDTFETKVKVVKARPPFYFLEGSASVAGKTCTKAEFSVAIVDK